MKKTDNLKLLNIDTSLYKTRFSKKFESRKPYQPVNPKIIRSFISGTVLDIFVREGQDVKKDEVLMILDAMKMQNRLKSKMKAKVKKIFVRKFDKVSKGAILLELE
jgi:biotin carboxyl carrier protein